MIWPVLLPVLLALEPTGGAPSSQQLYERPLVRPFEPASSFGREPAQGDEESEAWRAPLIAPVTVETYRHTYEVSPSDRQIAYEQAVVQREIDYDDRMGPLDGRWRVIDPSGRPVLSLVMSDAGAGTVEGAWLKPAQPGRSADLAPVQAVRREASGLVAVSLGDAGSLTLHPATDGQWVGVMTHGREALPVVVRRPA